MCVFTGISLIVTADIDMSFWHNIEKEICKYVKKKKKSIEKMVSKCLIVVFMTPKQYTKCLLWAFVAVCSKEVYLKLWNLF